MTSSPKRGSQGDAPDRPNREETNDQRTAPEARNTSLREGFPDHFRPTAEEFDRLWDEGMFVIDTNVLLHLYRYSRQTRDELLRVLRALGDKLFLPHQVGREFLDRRLATIRGQRGGFSKVRALATGVRGQIEEELRKVLRLRAGEDLPEGIRNALEEVPHGGYEKLAERLRDFEEALPRASNSPDDDEVWAAVERLFEDKVGPAYGEKEEHEVREEARRRKEAKVPPGFKDSRPGDYLIWRQTLDEAGRSGRPVVFVTDDRKEDWWWDEQGETLGPRGELIVEMRREAGVPFYMYTPDRLMGQARERLGVVVSERSISEAEELGREPDYGPGAPDVGMEGAARSDAYLRGMLDELLMLNPQAARSVDELLLLDRRELGVAEAHLVRGLDPKEIAEELGLSELTAHVPLRRAKEKLGTGIAGDPASRVAAHILRELKLRALPDPDFETEEFTSISTGEADSMLRAAIDSAPGQTREYLRAYSATDLARILNERG